MLEVELKLAAPSGFQLPDLTGLAEGVRAAPAEPTRLRTTYWDTEDLRLTRWGCSLRHRAGEGWTVKLPGEVNEGVLARPEITFGGSPRSPAGEAVDLIRAFVRTESLRPVVRLRTNRQRIDLVQNGSEPVAAVCLDDVTVLDGRRVADRFREVEIELSPRGPGGLASAVRRRLAAGGAGQPDPTSKLVRALGEQANRPAEVPDQVLTSNASVRDVISAAVSASTRRLILHDPLARLGEDPEAVHQCRVATRRLRSDLRTFRPYLDTGRTEPIRDELRRLGRILGAVRDADVLAEALRQTVDGLPDKDREASHPLLAQLDAERDRSQDALLDTLRGKRYLLLVDRLVGLARDPALVGDPDQRAVSVLPTHIDRPWRGLRKEVRGLGDPPTNEELHRVRILTKRCRYAAEAVAPVAGKRAASFAKAAARLQDVLGDHQDAVVAEAWLRAGVTGARGREAFQAGLLAERFREQQRVCREAFPKAWKQLKRRGTSSWA